MEFLLFGFGTCNANICEKLKNVKSKLLLNHTTKNPIGMNRASDKPPMAIVTAHNSSVELLIQIKLVVYIDFN